MSTPSSCMFRRQCTPKPQHPKTLNPTLQLGSRFWAGKVLMQRQALRAQGLNASPSVHRTRPWACSVEGLGVWGFRVCVSAASRPRASRAASVQRIPPQPPQVTFFTGFELFPVFYTTSGDSRADSPLQPS